MTPQQKLTTAMQDAFELALERLKTNVNEDSQRIAFAAGDIAGDKFEAHIVLTMNTPDFLTEVNCQLVNAVHLGEVTNARHVRL